MKVDNLLLQEYGTYSWRKALAYTQAGETYVSPETYVAAVRRYCGQRIADGRLIKVGFRRWPLSLWQRAIEGEELPRLRNPLSWLAFWEKTQGSPHVVGSSYNGDVDDVFPLWCRGMTPEQLASLRKAGCEAWVGWRIVARLVHRRDIPRSRLLSRARAAAQMRVTEISILRKGDLVRMMKAPYEVFGVVVGAAKEGGNGVMQYDTGSDGRQRSRVNWERVAELLSSPDRRRYLSTKYLWGKEQGYIPSELLRKVVPRDLIPRIDKTWLLKTARQVRDLAPTAPICRTEAALNPLVDPTVLRGVVAMSLIWPRGDVRGIAWLTYQVRHRGITVHDAILHLPLSEGEGTPGPYVAGFGEWLGRHKDTDLQLVGVVGAAWATLSGDEKRLPVQQLVAHIRSRGYGPTAHALLAKECALWGLPPEEFPKVEQRWVRAVLHVGDDDVTIPEVHVVLPGVKYRLDTLPRSDPRALWLGAHTNCCQHIGGAARTCAWYGVESSDSGFWVVTDPQTGNIVAQSWVWAARSPDDGRVLVADSVEALPGHDEDLGRLYRAAAEQAVSVDTPKSVDAVHVGWSRTTRTLGLQRADAVPTPPGVYTDAHEQLLLARRPVISIDRIKKIERQAYAGADHMCQLQACQTLQDVAAYCEVKPEEIILLGKPGGDWYAIVTLAEDGSGEWVDAAKMPGSPPFPLPQVLEDLRRRGAKRLRVDARHETAFRVLQKRGSDLGVQFVEEGTWDWDGVQMHAGILVL